MENKIEKKSGLWHYIFHRWEFWLIVFILIIGIILTLIMATSPEDAMNIKPESVNGPDSKYQPKPVDNPVDTQPPAGSPQSIAAVASSVQGVGAMVNMLVLLVVTGFIIGIFTKLSRIFK